MSHPIPNLSVNPIYSMGWILLAMWLLAIAVITWRHYRRTQANPSADREQWQVLRPEPLILEGEVIRMREAHEETAPLQLAEPQSSRQSA